MQASPTSPHSRRSIPERLLPWVATVLAFSVGWSVLSTAGAAPAAFFGVLVFASLLSGSPMIVLGVFTCVLFTRLVDLVPAVSVVQPAKMAAVAAVYAVGLIKLYNRDTRWARSPLNVWMVLLTLAWALSSFRSVDPAASLRFFVDVMVKITVLWFLLINVLESKKRAYAFQDLIAVMTAALAGYSIYAKVEGMITVEGTRAAFVGYLSDPNDLCLTLLMAFPFLLEATLSRRGASKLLYALLALVVFAGIINTQSRGGLLGLAAGGYVVAWQRTKNHTFTAAVGVAALLFLVGVAGIADRQTTATAAGAMIDTSAQGRIDAWIAGILMLIFNPIDGVGIDQVHLQFSNYAINPVSWRPKTSHNVFIQVAAETGFAGLVPFTALVFSSLHIAWRLRRKLPEGLPERELAFRRGLFPSMLGVMVAAMFLSVAWYWFPYILFAQAATAERIWLGFGQRESIFDGLSHPER